MLPLSVVVDDFNLHCALVGPDEADTPLAPSLILPQRGAGNSGEAKGMLVHLGQDRLNTACPNGVSAKRHWPESLPPSMMSSVPVM